MNNINKKVIIITLIIALITLTACTSNNLTAEVTKEYTIKIGFIAPLTGDISNWGESMKNGLDIALEEINSKRNNKIEIIYEDSDCNPKQAVSAFNKLVNIDKVEVVIGPLCSGSVLAVAPIANQNKVISFSPVATGADITYAGDYVFRNSISDAYQGKFLAEFVFNNLNIKKVGVIYVNNDYGSLLYINFKKTFEDLNGKIISENYNFGNTDFRTTLAKIKNKDIDALVIISYGLEGGLIAKQARELNIDVQFIGTDNFGTSEVLEAGGNAVENSIFITPALDESNLAVKRFMQKYEQKYNTQPPILWAAANSYDAIKIVNDAIAEVGYDADKVRDYLYNLKNYQGTGGITTFDTNGNVDKPLSLQIIKNRGFLSYSP